MEIVSDPHGNGSNGSGVLMRTNRESAREAHIAEPRTARGKTGVAFFLS